MNEAHKNITEWIEIRIKMCNSVLPSKKSAHGARYFTPYFKHHDLIFTCSKKFYVILGAKIFFFSCCKCKTTYSIDK